MSDVNDQVEGEELDNTQGEENTNEELSNIEENVAEQLPENNNYYFQDSSSFKDQLTEFFTKHRPSKLKHVKAIAKQYKGQEEEALDYLYYKYVTRVEFILAKKRVPRYVPGQKLAARIGDKTTAEDRKRLAVSGRQLADSIDPIYDNIDGEVPAPKNGSKKWIIIVVLLVLLAVAAYFLKDMFMGGAGDHDGASEQVEEMLNSEEKLSPESLEHAQTVEDSVAMIEKMLDEGVASDSTNAGEEAVDSVQAESGE